MYKVFVLGKPLFFVSDIGLVPGVSDHGRMNVHQPKAWGALLEGHGKPEFEATVVLSDDVEKSWEAFCANYKAVHAAGGAVRNAQNQWLFIFRNGYWDLPKGKLNPGEGWEEAALREVGEECGLSGHRIVRPLIKTYHTYSVYGPEMLKTTQWYEMEVPGMPDVVPEEKEGITRAVWKAANALDEVRANTYGSITDVLDYLLPQ